MYISIQLLSASIWSFIEGKGILYNIGIPSCTANQYSNQYTQHHIFFGLINVRWKWKWNVIIASAMFGLLLILLNDLPCYLFCTYCPVAHPVYFCPVINTAFLSCCSSCLFCPSAYPGFFFFFFFYKNLPLIFKFHPNHPKIKIQPHL